MYPENVQIAGFGGELVNEELDRLVHAAADLNLLVGLVSTHLN